MKIPTKSPQKRMRWYRFPFSWETNGRLMKMLVVASYEMEWRKPQRRSRRCHLIEICLCCKQSKTTLKTPKLCRYKKQRDYTTLGGLIVPQLGTPSYSHPPNNLLRRPLLFSRLFAAHLTKNVSAASTKMITAATVGTTTILIRSFDSVDKYGHVPSGPETQHSGMLILFKSINMASSGRF
jgi:hypothetical protein